MKDKIKKLKKLKKTANNKDVSDEYERKIKEYHDNRVAFYDSWTKAWISNRVEMDKQLLTLSALAVGFLITFFKDIDELIPSIIWLIATISFVISGIISYKIFRKNASYIETLLNLHQDEGIDKTKLETEEKKKTGQLTSMSNWATHIFLLGAALTIILAIWESELAIILGLKNA